MGEFIIHDFNSFCAELLKAGFSMGGGNSEGIYAVIPFSWDTVLDFNTPIKWHTGDMETDPWEWRMRVLDERDDIAYAKLFFNKSGFITMEWYPYFLRARRDGQSFEDMYQDGKMSHFAKRIYAMVSEHEALPLHAIKQLGGFTKEDKSQFDRALSELQMKMFITMCGRRQKVSAKGEAYGWSSTVFCTVERFFDAEVFSKAATLSMDEACAAIRKQVYLLNPNADEKKIKRFIGA